MSSVSEYLVPFFPTITILVALAGWGVLIRNTRRIATRGETYAIVQSLLAILDKVETEARDYWLKNAESWSRDKAAGFVAQVSDAIETLRLLSEVAQQRALKIDAIRMLGLLRQSLTLDAERLSTVDREQRVEKISAATSEIRDLKKQTYQSFMSVYPIDMS